MTEISVPICGRCKKPIVDVALIEVGASIILQEFFDPIPQIFRCKESADNFSRKIQMHEGCWIDTQNDHGVSLHNITDVLQELRKKSELQINQKTSKKKGRNK